VLSFKDLFESERFLFISLLEHNASNFISVSAERLGIKHYDIYELSSPSNGQADTVAQAVSEYPNKDESLTIFNIDTFRPNYAFPTCFGTHTNYLEVFRGSGSNWSYVLPEENSNNVIKTAEKKAISDLCCTGLYHFSSVNTYLETYEIYSSKPNSEWEYGELYIAPMYNILIDDGRTVKYNEIRSESVVFCGTPSEYEGLLRNATL